MSIARESLLHYIWKQKLMPHGQLKTTLGEEITILSEGSHNSDSGPDFSEATIKIGQITWIGQVELHIRSSDWLKHRHQCDAAYNAVILHVVWEHDADIYTGKSAIPTLELRNFISHEQAARYEQFTSRPASLPCLPWLPYVPDSIRSPWTDHLTFERLHRKCQVIKSLFTRLNYHAEHTLLTLMAGTYGLKVNQEAFMGLLQEIPWPVLQKCRQNLFSFEALLFGRAGLLAGSPPDEYTRGLKQEFSYIRTKFPVLEGYTSIPLKYGRMRPSASPVLRIALFCAAVHKYPAMLQHLLDATEANDAFELFRASPSPYWLKHHRFGRSSSSGYGAPGSSFFDLLLINALAPFLYFYGIHTGRHDLKQKAIRWLKQTPPENNKVTRSPEYSGLSLSSAWHSQALLELSSQYCNTRQCARCAIGRYVMGQYLP